MAFVLPREWEYHLKTDREIQVTPGLVQRDYSIIISQVGQITKSPKPRGYSSGRIKGYKKSTRTSHQVIKKTKKVSQKIKKAA